MSVEDGLKNMIIQKYGSVLSFCTINNVPQSTIATILKRGLQKSTFSNVIFLCNALGISADGLAEGKIIPISREDSEPQISVEEILNVTKNQLLSSDTLTLECNPANSETIDCIVNAIDIGVEMAKKKKQV